MISFIQLKIKFTTASHCSSATLMLTCQLKTLENSKIQKYYFLNEIVFQTTASHRSLATLRLVCQLKPLKNKNIRKYYFLNKFQTTASHLSLATLVVIGGIYSHQVPSTSH